MISIIANRAGRRRGTRFTLRRTVKAFVIGQKELRLTKCANTPGASLTAERIIRRASGTNRSWKIES